MGSWVVTVRLHAELPKGCPWKPSDFGTAGGPESLAFEDARQAGDRFQAEEELTPARP
jgi:hypothetical protein